MRKETASIWITGDQLLLNHPAIAAAEAEFGRENIQIVMVESAARLGRLPYHRKKLVLVLSAMRHFAEAMRARGYPVDYRHAETISDGLGQHLKKHRSSRLFAMEAAEFDARRFQQERLPKLIDAPVTLLSNTQFLCGEFNPLPDARPEKRYIMENFYRRMRAQLNVLMERDGQPAGGKWNFDEMNRKPLPRQHPLPDIKKNVPDKITEKVIREVRAMENGAGEIEGFHWAVTHKEAAEALEEFIATRLSDFGPYEDAMTTRSATLFHSTLSAYVNIGLLTPLQMIRAAEKAYRQGKAPIHSVEGFIRQILGWREYIYWQYWRLMPALHTANHWKADRPMPAMFWERGEAGSDMNCIRHVVDRVLEDGYSHHIERLMIVCNFCLLAGIDPREVSDWFLSLYVDAYDWVVLPNVIGMGLNADGGQTATKPYIASANYINKMSDYCGGCRYDHKQRTGPEACPFNFLYWNFLLQNEKELRANPRMGPGVLGVARLQPAERAAIAEQAAAFLGKKC